jgi:hypothetical protein
MSLIAYPLLTAALALGGPAQPADTSLLLVPLRAEGVSEKTVQRLEAVLTEALRARSDIEISELVSADSALEKGRRSLADLRFDEAAKWLRRGVQALLADPARLDFGKWSNAQLNLATALFRAGEEREAKDALVELITFVPSFRLPNGFPPIFRREFEKAKKRIQKRPKSQLAVDGSREWTVTVDGRSLGRAPVLVDRIPVGTHLVQVEGSGGDRFGCVVEISPGKLAKVRAAFPGQGLVIDENDLARLGRLARAAGADDVLWGIVTRASGSRLAVSLVLYSSEADGVAALESVSVEIDADSARGQLKTLADEVAKRVASFGSPDPLPVTIAARGSPAQPSPVPSAPGAAPAPALVPRGASTSSSPAVTGPTPRQTEDAGSAGPRLGPSPAIWKTWVIVTAGVVAAVGVGIGAYLGYNALRPVTGTVSASW